jgi:uncharacterized protein YndB with AHSA1/START domain
MTHPPGCRYAVHIASTPEKVGEALTDTGLTAVYRGHRSVSGLRPGSRGEHVRTDGSGVADVIGRVMESEPPVRPAFTWAAPGEEGREDRHSGIVFEMRPYEDVVRLTVTHGDLGDEDERSAGASGRPAVLSNPKSPLETGLPLPREPWRLPSR